jgi:hypothetical protein
MASIYSNVLRKVRFKAQETTPSVWLIGAYTALNTIISIKYAPKIKSKMIVNFVKKNESKPFKRVSRGLRFELVPCANNKALVTELTDSFDYSQHCYD